jgi:hypothetical protein
MKEKKMNEKDYKEVAQDLYLALIQMKKRRGVHMDDIDLVFDALEKYESKQLGEDND